MKCSDSIHIAGLILLALFLGGCTTEGSGHGAGRDEIDLSIVEANRAVFPLAEIGNFKTLCLAAPHMPEQKREIALSRGWEEADDATLEAAGLARLRKQVLEIPGGGGRFSETQHILVADGPAGPIILDLEKRLAGNELRTTLCALYSQSDFLKTCEQVGRLVNKAPDRNQRYPEKGAHFIQWNTVIEGRDATISCSRTPQSEILPYDGTVISVSIDHSGTAVKTAFRPVRSSQATSVDSGR